MADDSIAHNNLQNEMRCMAWKLEKDHGQRLPGSPTWSEVLMDFYQSDPKNSDFQKGKELVDQFENLNILISSNPDRLDAFMKYMR